MTTGKNVDDNMPPEAPPPEKPPTGVATMSIVRWVLVAITAVVAIGSIVSYAGVHLGGASKSEPSKQLYYCPMHPSVVQDHPGECPICGMTLVPKSEGNAQQPPPSAGLVPGLSSIDLTPERIQLKGCNAWNIEIAREYLREQTMRSASEYSELLQPFLFLCMLD